MAKLYFRYGVVSSAKTLNLLATIHNYEIQNKRAILLKPSMDTRSEDVSSRAGLSHKADLVVSPNEDINHVLYPLLDKPISGILVDEVQFFTPQQIEGLRKVSVYNDIPVLCYGLRTKSDATLWPSIITLMALADSIEEIKTTCMYCDNKAIFSKAVEQTDADGVKLSWNAFVPVCAKHFYDSFKKEEFNV